MSSRRPRQAPAINGGAFDRAEHQTLRGESDAADDDERRKHHVGVEEFLGVEDDPAKTPIGAGQHFGADDRDPGAQEGLTQAGNNKRRSAWNDHLPEQRALVGPHGACRTQPDRIDRPHTRPAVDHHRKKRRIEHDQDAHGVAEAEPQNEDRHPGKRRDRHQCAGQRQDKTLHRPETSHHDAERQADSDRESKTGQHSIKRRSRMKEHGAVAQRVKQRVRDGAERRHQGRREIAAAGDGFIDCCQQ